jgi:hypothetical protein
MEILKGQEDLSRVKLCLSQRELFPLDVQHEITTAYIFHDEVYASLGLETGMKSEQKGVSFPRSGQEDALLRLGA